MVWAICAFLIVAVAAVFGQTAYFGFVNLDDDQYVTNSAETQLGLSAEGIKSAWTQSQVGSWHPLTTMSFMLDWQMFGMKAGGYHLHNVVLHAASAVLLFLLLRRVTGATLLSAMTAAIFAVHPLRAESVAWVTERTDVLSGLFFVLTLGAYAIYATRPSGLRYAAVLVLFTLGLMCKAILVTLPVILLLLDYWPLRRLEASVGEATPLENGTGKQWLKRAAWLALEKLPLFILAMAFSIVTANLSLSATRSVAVLPLQVRMAMAPVSYVGYLGQMFFPRNLSAHYPYAEDGSPIWQVAIACVFLAAISWGVWALRRKRPYLLVGWLWYIVIMLPVIGLVPGGNQLVADRYTYLPQIGLALALVWAAADLTVAWPHGRRVGLAVSSVVLVALMVCAWKQTSYWRDSETLWRHALSCTSDNAIAHEHLGTALEQLGRTDDARAQYQQTLAITPRSLPALCNLGNILNNEGKVDEAIELYRRALDLNLEQADVYYNMGNALLRKGSEGEAMASYRRAVRIDPRHAAAHNNLGNVLNSQGRTAEALDEYRLAIESNPRNVDAYENCGDSLMRLGRLDEAGRNFQKALDLDPLRANAMTKLGDVSREKGDIDTAEIYYRKALQADPVNLPACNNLGDALNRQGKTDEAIAVYQRAVKIAPQVVVVWYNLGVCLEQKDRRAEAIYCYEKALKLAEAQNNAGSVESIRAKIKACNENGKAKSN